MIRARGVAVSRETPGREAGCVLRGVDLDLGAGELVLVLGRPGAGKTTLLEALAGLLPLAAGRISVRLPPREWTWSRGDRVSAGGGQVGLLFQYPERQIFGRTAREDVSWGLEDGGGAAVERALSAAEIQDSLWDAPLGRLSRGEKRRVALAGVLAREPGVLLLDEPSVGLDETGRALLWREVEAYRRDRGAPVAVATHWPDELLHRTDRVVCLADGAVAFSGGVEELLERAAVQPDLEALLPLVHRLELRLSRDRAEGPFGREGSAAAADWLRGRRS